MTSLQSPRMDESRPASAADRRALAHVFALLEQLADVLAAPQLDMSQFEAVVRGCIAHLRAAGVPEREIAGRLTRLVHAASAPARSASETTARVASVVDWCERAEHPAAGIARAPH
jgi:hypothetical protein